MTNLDKTMPAPEFRKNFDPQYGEAIEVAPNVQRVVAANRSAFTFTGTNTYIIGKPDGAVAVLDPGPGEAAAPGHLETLLAAIGGRQLSHILISHTHRDHTEHAASLKRATGAPIFGFGPHVTARPLAQGEVNALDAAGDDDIQFDSLVKNSDLIEGDGWTLEAIHTPGHTENHLCFALAGTDILFSADHVMGWATSIVAPPDGDMAHYMASLDGLLARPESAYFPGHGGRIENAHTFTRAIRNHRIMREEAILAQVQRGNTEITGIVKALYADVPTALHGAAALSVQAHLEHLQKQGRV